MLYIGIDVSKHKHDCFITNSDGEVVKDVFTVRNSMEGFNELLENIREHQQTPSTENTKIGLEATGHYSDNIVRFLKRSNLSPIVLNPLRVNLYRKGQTLRKTKTDKSDARFIAKMLITEDVSVASLLPYDFEELKSLTRHRHRLVKIRSMYKISFDRLLNIVFPEFENYVSNTLGATEKNILLEMPTAKAIAGCHLTHLVNLAKTLSRGHHDKQWAINLKMLAENSIGSSSPAKALEMQQILRQIMSITNEIDIVENEIKMRVEESGSTLTTIPGVSYTLAGIIIAEIGDISRFESPAKLQAFAGLDPTTYQSGQYVGGKDVMVKRGSTYLRWALLMVARIISRSDSIFNEYLNKKISEGKHYNSAMGHVAKKLIRVIYHLMNSGEAYSPQF